MKDIVERAMQLAVRVAGPQPVLSSDASITRIICTIEEKDLIVRALNCLADVNRQDAAEIGR